MEAERSGGVGGTERERQRERECVCVCVCVTEREIPRSFSLVVDHLSPSIFRIFSNLIRTFLTVSEG